MVKTRTRKRTTPTLELVFSPTPIKSTVGEHLALRVVCVSVLLYTPCLQLLSIVACFSSHWRGRRADNVRDKRKAVCGC